MIGTILGIDGPGLLLWFLLIVGILLTAVIISVEE
jgi:hypothetical protein